ncbi:hypothetical protein SDRG_05613 [Saprolegnia diclina VS20]|uniref:AAR2 splicing factor homolog n=1 Tax=Saprolegnia diclina (strain VS20) TaxID=1156394 RepID=T0QFQ4_SAPDV|nr:hypothetical protein SDRG_05613 [Saprolegnia diclina VS20]EQC36779.1 hypothetical protein SDRG_05613 [Saprolegnia diclina VS20]|eukprot:XP_008609560.1 hypothetical protein SDRG_05613 [Saprolegnia diclina VS20]
MAQVGVLVCLDVPVGSEFGVDYEAFRTAERFQGVKLLPTGLHFVFYASSGDQDGIRQGFFIHVNAGDVTLRKWSHETEELLPLTDARDAENLTRAVHGFQLDGNLGAYPQKHAKTWRRLSKYISANVLRRCGITLGATIMPGDPDVMSTNEPSTLTPYFPNTAQTARFTPLKKPALSRSAAEVTLFHVDSSEHLHHVLAEHFSNDWKELLGELQLSFVLFLLISSLDALTQWKQMVWLLCSSEAAVESMPDLFIAFLKLMHTHLDQVGAEFFQDEVAQENFLQASLASLFEILHDDNLDPKLLTASRKLQSFLQQKFNLRFDVLGTFAFGDDECAPAFVLPDELPAYVFGADVLDDDANARAAAALFH